MRFEHLQNNNTLTMRFSAKDSGAAAGAPFVSNRELTACIEEEAEFSN